MQKNQKNSLRQVTGEWNYETDKDSTVEHIIILVIQKDLIFVRFTYK